MGKTIEYVLTEEEKENIINDYKNNVSIRELAKKYNHSRSALSNWLVKVGAKTTAGNHYRKYFHDFDFFENIDTEEKAYWLGFMFADGYIINHDNKRGEDRFGLTLSEDSLDSLQKFKQSIKATNPIYKEELLVGQNRYTIVCTSQKTVNDLIDKGCVKQKSLILEPPKKVPDFLMRHFLRGFFDGDGGVSSYTKPNGHKNFILTYTSTEPMIKWIQEYFQMGQIRKEPRHEKTWSWQLGGNKQVLKFYHCLYDDSTIWMDRKYNKFQELVNKYSKS